MVTLRFLALGVIAVLSLRCKSGGPAATVSGPDDAGRVSVAATAPKERPAVPAATVQNTSGDVDRGKDVFRFETFGNEGFWTDAARLPKGMMQAKMTMLDGLRAGLQFDVEAIPTDLRARLEPQLKTDLTRKSAPLLHDPNVMLKLVEANAVGGLVPKDKNGDGKIDLAGGDKLGISCTICHVRTDASVFDMPGGGSVGRRIDGLAAVNLDVGKLMATAANSRAIYPNLQAVFLGVSIGNAKKGLGPKSTEAEVDAYLLDRANYPVGTFDDTQDGIGNPVVNTPLFRQDLAGPYGTAGEHLILENISNASYTTNLDPTMLVTPEGRKFLEMKAGPAGAQLAKEYAEILEATGVTGFPFVQARLVGNVGDPASPVGRRVDDQKLLDMNAYLAALPAPRGKKVDAAAEARGRALFAATCTSCHAADQSQPVPPLLVELKTMWPAYVPLPVGKRGEGKLSAILNSPGNFDNKLVIVDASDRGDKRGIALPLLLDLARKQRFLHDASVVGLDSLLDPARGKEAPHPFYVEDPAARRDLIAALEGFDTEH